MSNKEINTIENFLSEDECNNIIDKFNEGQPIDTSEILQRIESLLGEKFKLKGHQFNPISPLICERYDKESKYSLSWNEDEISHFGILIQLNNDYKNGYTQFSVDRERHFQVPKKTGSLTIFFSNIKHRQAPVEEGQRYTLETNVSTGPILNHNKTLI